MLHRTSPWCVLMGMGLVVLWKMSEHKIDGPALGGAALNGKPSVIAGRCLRRTRLMDETSTTRCLVWFSGL